MTVKELKAMLETIDENKVVYIIGSDGRHYTTNIRIEENTNIYIEEK